MRDTQYKTIIEAIEAKLDKFFEMHGSSSPESGLYKRVIDEVERILIQKTINHAGDQFV